jgi:3-oxoacyl-[acyl-carrier-protein] synthase-3
MPTSILGLAHRLPPSRPVGDVRRPIADEPGGASDMALEPSRQALAQAGVAPGEVDFIVFATMTADVTFPGSAVYLQDKLGCGTVGSLDVRGQCTGFLMALMTGESFLASGMYRRILLAAAEVHSSGLDYSERGLPVASLYGDGGAAAVLGPDAGGIVLEAVVCHSDGRHHERFWCEYPASRQHPLRITPEDFRRGLHFPTLDFERVREFGVAALPEVVGEVLRSAGASLGAVDCFILSHVLADVVPESARRLSIPADRLIDAGAEHGHLTAASLPAALDAALRRGRVAKGARVCLATCGAGFTWGAALLRV